MKLREFRPSDVDDVQREMQLNFGEELALQGWDPDHFRGMIERAFGFPVGWLLAVLGAVGRAPAHLLVAEEQGHVVATTFVFFQKTHGYIAVVMTDPAFRGKGIASALLQRAEEIIRRRHRRWAVLDVLTNNTVAKRLYDQRGYRPVRLQHWLVRAISSGEEAPRNGAAILRPMEKKDLRPLLELYRAQIPPEAREILAPEKSWLDPPPYLQAMMEATSAAWCTGPRRAPSTYVRATFTTPKEAGNLGAPLLDPRSTAEERALLLPTALHWLASLGATKVVTQVPSYHPDVLELLRRSGFQEKLTMETRVLALDGPLNRR